MPSKVKIPTMGQLRAERGQPLTLTVTVPHKAKALFLAISELYPNMSKEEFAAMAMLKFLTCEEALERFDKMVSELL